MVEESKERTRSPLAPFYHQFISDIVRMQAPVRMKATMNTQNAM
jgi:hypothetical protein